MGWPKIKFEESEMTTKMNDVHRRLDDLEEHKLVCNSKHDKCEDSQRDNHDYRRKTDSKLDGIYVVATEMLTIMRSYKEYEPSMRRTQNNFITLDTLKAWGVWIAAIAGAFTAVFGVFSAFMYLRGLL